MHCFVEGMDKIRIKDKTFRPYIPSDEIARAVARVACCIREDMEDERPLFIVMLNGAFVFASGFVARNGFPCEVAIYANEVVCRNCYDGKSQFVAGY